MATILVVDDDTIGQRMLGYTLQKNGHQVVSAFNGRIALERMDEQLFDLVLSQKDSGHRSGEHHRSRYRCAV